jgi:hypothetical protein
VTYQDEAAAIVLVMHLVRVWTEFTDKPLDDGRFLAFVDATGQTVDPEFSGANTVESVLNTIKDTSGRFAS